MTINDRDTHKQISIFRPVSYYHIRQIVVLLRTKTTQYVCLGHKHQKTAFHVIVS